jgi:hypothetical protein
MFSTTFPKSFPTREISIRIPIRHDVCARSTAASGSAKPLYNDADLIPYESKPADPLDTKGRPSFDGPFPNPSHAVYCLLKVCRVKFDSEVMTVAK